MTGRHRLARRRKAVGHTQESLAALLGVDRSTTARWEHGSTEPMAWLRPRLAAALKVTVEELADLLLIGADLEDHMNRSGLRKAPTVPVADCRSTVSTSLDRRTGPANRELTAVVAQVRQAMQDASFDALVAADEIQLDVLDRRVAALWRSWHSSDQQRSAVGPLLPGLVRQLHRAARTDDVTDRRRAQALLGHVYRLVQRFLAHISEPDLHALAVERGRSYSEAADQPYSLALAAWSSAISASALGHFDEAARVAALGARILEPSLKRNGADDLGAYGALQLESAAAHGFAGRIDTADRHLAAAATVAERLAFGYWHLPSGFERSSVTILEVILRVARGATADAVSLGEAINPHQVPSLVRRSRLLLELGLAHSQQRDPYGAVYFLGRAAGVSREAVALIPWAVDLAGELAASAPNVLKRDASELAADLVRQVPA